jgi:hypothetical protein
MAFDIVNFLTSPALPQWFLNLTGGIQALGIIVSFLISYIGYKAYKLTKERKYRYFFYGFLFLGLSFLANLALNIVLRLGYARYFVERRYDPYILPLFLGYYFFLIGVMLAYVSFAVVYADIKDKNRIWLLYLWTFIIGIYTFRDDLLFNVFSAVLISFTVLFSHEKYLQTRNKNTLYAFLAFLALFIFHILILLQQTIPAIIALRNMILLTGLLLLLITLYKIHGGKKK